MSWKKIIILPFILWAIFFPTLAQAVEFPALELLNAIKELESKDQSDAPLLPYFEYRKKNLNAPAVEWDASAQPDSIKSWMQFQLSEETLELLRKNIDEKGQKLL